MNTILKILLAVILLPMAIVAILFAFIVLFMVFGQT